MIGRKKGNLVQAFTVIFPGRVREIITNAGVSIPFEDKLIDRNDNRIINTKALWDTGATGSVITKEIATRLNLIPISVVKVSGFGGIKDCNVYLVHLYLAENIAMRNVRVMEIEDIGEGCGIIFGMNFIGSGNFAIIYANGVTTFSVQWPSVEVIDFEKDLIPLDAQNQKNKPIKTKVSRNQPCPCGSGKKYKRCHGKTS